MIKASPDLTVEIKIDASKQGWGAVCQEAWTQEVWSEQEKNLHINVLKLKAVTFAVQAFTKDKRDCHVHSRVDNTTAVAQINKMDGTWSRDLLLVAKELWQYCTKRSITLTVEHLRECRTQWWTNNRGCMGTSASGSWTYNAFAKWTTSGAHWRWTYSQTNWTVRLRLMWAGMRTQEHGKQMCSWYNGPDQGLCIFLILPDWQVPSEGDTGVSRFSVCDASVAGTSMLPQAVSDVNRQLNLIAKQLVTIVPWALMKLVILQVWDFSYLPIIRLIGFRNTY